jgi:23S rRNA (adenine2503-C2)-methyltransferase
MNWQDFLFFTGMVKVQILSLPLSEWAPSFKSLGGPNYRARQVRDWVFKQFELEFENMTNIPRNYINLLKEKFHLQTLELKDRLVSKDGTVKWLLRTTDRYLIECVLIPEGKRRSICLSTQVGCAMGCKFCSTAKMGLLRNLTLGEILEQYVFVSKYLRDTEGKKLTNAIFMGMGEPLQNLEAVVEACRIIASKEGFQLSRKKITVSTSGLIPQLIEWAQQAPEFNLAVSLNGSNNAVRSELMPVNKRFPLPGLLEAVDEYTRITKQKPTFEYVLIKNKTCTTDAAKELRKIVSKRGNRINLILLNEDGMHDYRSPSEQEAIQFKQILNGGNLIAVIRKPRGRDINAACGQLIQLQKKVA